METTTLIKKQNYSQFMGRTYIINHMEVGLVVLLRCQVRAHHASSQFTITHILVLASTSSSSKQQVITLHASDMLLARAGRLVRRR